MSENKNHMGAQLVKRGIITQQQLDEALSRQKNMREQGVKGLLGQILVDMQYCTAEDIAKTVAHKSNAFFISLSEYQIDTSALNLLSPALAQKYQALPIGFESNSLLVAMMDPNDIIAIDDLRLLSGYEVQPVVVPDKELETAIRKYVQASSDTVLTQDDDTVEDESDPSADKPAVQLANQILNQAVKASASDVHIEPQEKSLRVRFRIDGVLHEIMQQPSRLNASLVSRIKVMANMDIAERRVPQDGRITLKSEGKTIDIRVASLPSAFGERVTLRLLNRSQRLITMNELGFTESMLTKYNQVLSLPYGFILITGPTGSGKSTTLYASLARLNSVEKNVITLEDPIERRMEGLNQVQMNTKAGMTFASGLRSILRNDPDIIMVGEIRDFETAKIAVESALTGHLVLSTLHTNDSAGAVQRLSDMGVEAFLTASSLAGVIAQRLMRVLCTTCKRLIHRTREEILESIPDFPLQENEQTVSLYHAQGCALCNGTGYRGRIGIYEFLPVSETIQKMIVAHASAHEIRDVAIREGMLTMRMDGLLKVKQGISTMEELLRVIA